MGMIMTKEPYSAVIYFKARSITISLRAIYALAYILSGIFMGFFPVCQSSAQYNNTFYSYKPPYYYPLYPLITSYIPSPVSVLLTDNYGPLNPGLTYRASSSNSFYSISMSQGGTSSYPGNYSLYNSALAPFTYFFSNPQNQPYAFANGDLINLPVIEAKTIAANSTLILANATSGMYCCDPIAWLEAGLQGGGIWEKSLRLCAQSIDRQGFLLAVAPAFSVQTTGQTGTMSLARSDLLLYEGIINFEGSTDYQITIATDKAVTTSIIHIRNATCDSCHPVPPAHIASSTSWGKCNICHNLSNVIHVHAYKAKIAVNDCYRCHPIGYLSGAHSQIGLGCADCHGNLEDAANNRMKISGQLGEPHCADCHDQQHSENPAALYVDSAGHGGIWCINCHGPIHAAESVRPLGYNNCQVCHAMQVHQPPHVGTNCKACHNSSTSPHLVT
jgi:hypothetical protein